MKNRLTRRRSEVIRRKMEIDSKDTYREAVRRVADAPAAEPPRGGFTPLGTKPESAALGAIKRRFKVGWRVLSLLICGLLGYQVYTAWQSPEFRVNSVKVSGLQRVAEADVQAILKLTGMHSFALEPSIIRSAILTAFPEFRDVQVNIGYPATVEVKVTERQPMIAWQAKSGLMYIDSEGYLIPSRGATADLLTIQADSIPGYSLKSPIEDPETDKVIRDKPYFKANPSALAFFAVPKQIDGVLLTSILQLNAWMPQEKTLLYQKQRGLGWSDTRGWDVFVGQKLEGINDKMVMYETIVRELEKQGISPTVVSVEFLHAPYYRTE